MEGCCFQAPQTASDKSADWSGGMMTGHFPPPNTAPSTQPEVVSPILNSAPLLYFNTGAHWAAETGSIRTSRQNLGTLFR